MMPPVHAHRSESMTRLVLPIVTLGSRAAILGLSAQVRGERCRSGQMPVAPRLSSPDGLSSQEARSGRPAARGSDQCARTVKPPWPQSLHCRALRHPAARASRSEQNQRSPLDGLIRVLP